MAKSLSILVLGRDANLLSTRKLVLEQAGHRVWLAGDELAVRTLVRERRIDLVILCHSLSAEDCSRALAVARSVAPHVKSLVLSTGRSGCVTELASAVLNTTDGPLALISKVDSLANLQIGNQS